MHGATLKEALAHRVARKTRLASRGFRVVDNIIVGSSGMIRAATQQHLTAPGLTATENLSLMQKHHDTAIKKIRKIL